MLRKTPLCALTAGLVLLAGCNQPAQTPAPGDTLTQQDARQVREMAQQSNLYLAFILKAQSGAVSLDPRGLLSTHVGAGGTLSTAALVPAEAPYPECLTQVGRFEDQDRDSFPASNVATYLNDCVFTAATPLGPARLKVNAEYSRNDQNDALPFPASGYRIGIGEIGGDGGASFDLRLNNYVLASGSTSLNYSVSKINDQDDGPYQMTSGFLLARSDINVDSFLSKDTNYTYTPEDDNNANPLDKGTLTGSSNVGFTPGGSARNVILNFTFNDLGYDSACSLGFRGNVVYSDNSGNNLTLNYNCNTVTATYNGNDVQN